MPNTRVVSVVLFLFLKYVYRNRIAMTKKIHPITRVIVVNMETLNMHKTKPDRMHRIADEMASVFVSSYNHNLSQLLYSVVYLF